MTLQKDVLKKHARLQQINKMISGRYDHLWDCCCDHGLLGITLLNREVAQTVHFVDIVPTLLEQLQLKLEKHWHGDCAAWEVHCADIIDLPIETETNRAQQEKHLVIIAGVGGELLIEFMRYLLVKTNTLDVEFIICPVHHNYKMREYLRFKGVGLIAEQIVEENRRFYEILHVSPTAERLISNVGDSQWDLTEPSHRQYLQQMISHYQRIANNPKVDLTHILNSYQALLNKC